MVSRSLLRASIITACTMLFTLSVTNAQFTGAYKRTKLIEQFTSATCGPCVAAAPVMNSHVVLANGVISIRYHMNYPAPGDPWNVMNGTHPQVRHDKYQVRGIPHAQIGGVTAVDPRISQNVVNALSQVPPTSMAKIVVKQRGGAVDVIVTTDRALSNARLHFTTVQRTVTITGLNQSLPNSNGETTFGDVMMFMYPDATGLEFSQAANETRTYTYTPGMGNSNIWNRNNLYGIALLQDNATNEVIQAAASVNEDTPPTFAYFMPSTVSGTINGIYERVDRGATAQKQMTLTNRGTTPVTVNLSVANSDALAQAGMSASFDPSSVTVPGNGNASTTIKTTGGTRSIFVGINAAVEATDGLGDIVPPLYYMVNGAKVVNFYGIGNEGAPLTQIAAQNIVKYSADVIYMPFSTEIQTAYPPTDFQAAIFAFDAYWLNLRGNVLTTVENLLKAKKGVWIQSQAGLYAAFDRYGTNTAFDVTRTWYRNVVGIELTKFEFRATFDANGNPTALITFPVRGTASDPIGNGITFTGNVRTTNHPFYTLGTDIFKLTSGSKAKPVLYYDNNANNIGMVRVEPTYGGKLVYGSVGAEIISSDAARLALTEKVIDYLLGSVAPGPAKISISSATVNFGSVEVDQFKEINFTLTNTGESQLSISRMDITGADALAFDITEGRPISSMQPVLVAPGATHTLKIRFSPTAVKAATVASLGFTSNAETNPTVTLRGAGVVAASVATDVVSETGAISLTLVGANPVTSSSSVRITANGFVAVTLVDAAGRTVGTLFDGVANGSELLSIGSSMLPSGTYSVVATNGSDRAVLTVMVVR